MQTAVNTAAIPQGPQRLSSLAAAARNSSSGLILVGPAALFFLVVFLIPVALMIRFSLYRQLENGDLSHEITFVNYARLLSVDLYRKALFTTLRVSVLTTLISIVLAYPLALVMSRGPASVSRLLTIVVIAPMLINVVVRAYAWRVILANSGQGMLNWALTGLGLGEAHLLYTEWAVIIGSVHVFLSTMVLPLAAALGKIDPAVEEAARTLGASAFAVFRRITLPLSVPGLAVGSSLVFSLTASAFVAPALLGGGSAVMLGPLVQEQILSVFDWPFGATLATALIIVVMAANLLSVGIVERRFRSRMRGVAT